MTSVEILLTVFWLTYTAIAVLAFSHQAMFSGRKEESTVRRSGPYGEYEVIVYNRYIKREGETGAQALGRIVVGSIVWPALVIPSVRRVLADVVPTMRSWLDETPAERRGESVE